MRSDARATLKSMLDAGRLIKAPGCGEALTATLIEQAGFPCVYMSGYQVSAYLGYPDVGLVTLTEMVQQASRICATVNVPVVVDGDNGHGNAINVARTTREFEQAGAAAIHFEDQSLPKKCGHMHGHVLIGVDEMCGKIRAAVETRRSPEFLIIGRSDAIAASTLDDAIERGRRYRQAGADAIMVMAPRSLDDLRRYRDAVEGPLVVTMGSWPFYATSEMLQQIGFQLVLYPLTTLRRATKAIIECLRELKDAGEVDHTAPDMVSMHDMHSILGLERILEMEHRYAPAQNSTTRSAA